MDAVGLHLQVTTAFDSETFGRFFEAYDKAFVLPDEKEEIGGFQSALGLNDGAAHDALVQRYGPFRELCLLAFEAQQLVGGVNLLACKLPQGDGAAGHVVSNLNYIFVERSQRGRGAMRRCLGQC